MAATKRADDTAWVAALFAPVNILGNEQQEPIGTTVLNFLEP